MKAIVREVRWGIMHRSWALTLLRAIATALAAGLVCPASVQASCSLYAGKVVVNEVYAPRSGTPFVEIKVLDPAVVGATSNFQNWKIDVYAGNTATKASVDVSSGFQNTATNSCGQTSLWIDFPDSVLNNFLSTYAPPFNFVLYDASSGGKIVDVMRLGNNVTSFYGSGSNYTKCSVIENQLPATGSANTQYDAQAGTGASIKDWFRIPDGTGPWGGQGTSNPANTGCSSNTSGGSTFGLAKVANTAVIPINTNFTYTLYAANGTKAFTNPASVVVTDNLAAAGLGFVSCATTQGTCTYAGGTVTWTVTSSGGMGANTSYSATLTVQSATVGSKTNSIVSNVGNPVVTGYAPAVTVTAPPLEYRMDGSAWTNNATVADSGANGANGTLSLPNGGTAAAVAGKVCGGASVSFNIGEGIQVAGNTAMDIANGGSISFWIKPTVNTNRYLFSKGADYFAYLDGGGKLVFGWGTGGGALQPRVTSVGAVPANAWTHVMLVFDNSALAASIYLNGSLDASGAATAPVVGAAALLIGSLDQATFTAYDAASGRTGFAGIIDEFKIFTSALPASTIFSFYNNEAAGLNYDGTVRNCTVAPDHVELMHDGAALTCTPKAVRVYACTTAASCSGVPANQYTVGSFSVSLTAIAGATWCSDSLCATPLGSPATLTNGQTIYLKDTNVRTDRIGGGSSAVNTVLQCANTGAGTFNATTACDLAFAAAGFLVSLPNHVSCSNATLTIKAVKSSDNSLQCTPAFTGTRTETIAFGYGNPTAGTLAPSVGGTAVTTGGSPVNLSFDATGTATPTFSYADVGLLSVTVSDAALNMTGSTTGVIAPASFLFSGIPAAPLTAGTPFNVTVGAMNACATPAATPNFGRETVPAAVTLSSSNYVPAIGNATAVGQTLGGFSAGQASANLTWNEVGTFDLTAATTNYLGSGLNASGTQAAVGRFKPGYFTTAVTPGCGGFTYSGQAIQNVTVKAYANGGATLTQNYAGATWAKQVTLTDGAGGTTGSLGNATLAASAFSAGSGSTSAATYAFNSKTTAPAMPVLRATDTDGVTSSSHVEGSTLVRSGVLRLSNAYGSDLLDVRVPLAALYWTGSAWATNTLDSCTTIPDTAIALGDYGGALGAANMGTTGGKCVCSAGSCTPAPCDHRPAATALAGGVGNIVLKQPSPAGAGSLDLALDLGTGVAAASVCLSAWANGPSATTAPGLSHLLGNWCGSAYDKAPLARIRLGVAKSPYLYLRERY